MILFNNIFMKYYDGDVDIARHYDKISRLLLVGRNVHEGVKRLLKRKNCDLQNVSSEVCHYYFARDKYYKYLQKHKLLDSLLAMCYDMDIPLVNCLTKRFKWITGQDVCLLDLMTIEMIPKWRSVLVKIPEHKLPKILLYNMHPEISLMINIENIDHEFYKTEDVTLKRLHNILGGLDLILRERICNYAYDINKEYFPLKKRRLAFFRHFY